MTEAKGEKGFYCLLVICIHVRMNRLAQEGDSALTPVR